MSEATIYEYFSTKEELLFNIPAEKIRRYQEKNLEILKYIHGAANKLRFLIRRHLELYAENPDYGNIAMLIIKFLQFRSKRKWSLSNLVVLLRWNLFTYRDLWEWINHPFETPPLEPIPKQMEIPV